MSAMRQEWRLLVCSECGEMDTDEAVCGFCDSAEGVTMIDVVPADRAVGPREFAERVAALGDPGNEDRHTIRLSELIEHARAALKEAQA